MANSYGQFTGWVSVSSTNTLKSEPSCTSYKLYAIFQRWQIWGRLQHGICPHAATQSYTVNCRVRSDRIIGAMRGSCMVTCVAWWGGVSPAPWLMSNCYEYCFLLSSVSAHHQPPAAGGRQPRNNLHIHTYYIHIQGVNEISRITIFGEYVSRGFHLEVGASRRLLWIFYV